MEDILALAKKVAEEAEVFKVSSEETPVRFEANRLKHIQAKQSSRIALRIVKNGRIGYAMTTGSGDSQDLVDMAVETAQFGMPTKFEFPDGSSYPGVDVFDAAADVPVEKMVELGEGLISVVRQHTPDIVCEADVTKLVSSIEILNSCGGRVDYQKSAFSMSIEGTLIRGTDILFVGEGESSCHPLSETKSITDVVLWQLEMAKEQAAIPTGSLPVILTPNGVASALLSPLMAAFNGKIVLEGASPLGHSLGQCVFDEKLSLWDDPTIEYRPGSRICDDEAVVSQQTPLIEQGRVASFLYDLQTAGLAGAKSTGNGSRGGGLPAPSPSAFTIAPGDASFDDMVQDIKEGLVIDYLMGAGQGNILGGDFSGNVLLGYKVERGKIVGRVKDTMVSGNVYQALKHITAIGSKARWVGGTVQTPHIYLPGLSVAAGT